MPDTRESWCVTGVRGAFPATDSGDPTNVFRNSAAATSHDIKPTVAHEAADAPTQHLRGLVIVPVFVGQAGVGNAGHREAGKGSQSADMVGHELRPGGAIKANPQEVAVGQGSVEGLDVLASQESAHGFHGTLDGNRNPAAQLGKGAVDALQSGLDVQRVLTGFQQQEIRAAFDETGGLIVVRSGQIVEGDPTGNGDGLGGGTHGAGDEAGLVGCTCAVGSLTGDGGGGPVNWAGFVGEIVFSENDGSSAKGVGLDDVGSGIEIPLMDIGDDVRPGED